MSDLQLKHPLLRAQREQMMFQQRDKMNVSLEARAPWQVVPVIMVRSCGQIKTGGESTEVIPCEKCNIESYVYGSETRSPKEYCKHKTLNYTEY